MPAFTFEKISPPLRRGSSSPEPEKPRGVLYQMIDRFAERRAKRMLREKHEPIRHDDKPVE
ncbi:hypothetical protein GCM10007857_28790 [Bradyrhizobium iriomotense]|uniref:Uncharacterized protein n=1 Tax=Bradyrhizobium iriomotense TaxID=441950 RepID=A0ABQ6B1W5_9BRAD|nr:hypothetical protein [Bradyrhizobium iriomotense]GLR86168.1 hypothetical protein GCM10007857_28790 [Bradyrhizobium iriomotense]